MKRKRVAGTAAVGAAAGVLGLTVPALPAGAADPNLPAIAPEKLVASVMTAQPPAMAGTVKVDNNLGLPAIPGLEGSSTALSGGTSTMRVWTDGQGKQRLSIPSTGEETTVINDGTTVWKWNSAENTVTKYRHDTGAESDTPHRSAPANPTATAKRIIDTLRQSSKVAVDGTASVAGRDAYELVLTPKSTERTVLREVRIAVGAEKRIPLRITVNTNGSDDPALQAGFSKLEVAPQDAELFRFTPPAGAQVRQGEQHERRDADSGTHPKPRVVGDGWDSVLVTRVPQQALQQRETRQGSEEQQRPGLRGFVERAGKQVSGPWGNGWIISSKAGSGLLTSDGRLAVGAVPGQVLTEAMRHP
ncbi:LolA family protein [Haloactinomyces albus]|uniref:Outer membrane lipoprotein-sorting protein n=1 Tax=Haloactinomyces albus TaxID=1352928 RepID=A0AAE4CMV5_9ACTN|nr:outer membrane lipoprotein carrier protein LolA [Haloactinomyces albus]MDR7302801.1 outer membrane lipoprotein-sorting protein [Haloactinomyces albus]